MSDPSDNANRQDFLDRHYPFIEQGAPPPGQMGWRSRHGTAVVRWQVGHPVEVRSAAYPDGSRGDVDQVLDHGYRRRATGPRRWVYGNIDIRADDVIFTDRTEQPSYMPPALTDTPDLEADLARDDAFLGALKNDLFAQVVNCIFRDRTFLKNEDERDWTCGDRQAAHLVADLRGLGESYQDYDSGGIVPGTWPDDRPLREVTLRKRVADASQPIRIPEPQVLSDEHWALLQRMVKLHPKPVEWSPDQERKQKEEFLRQIEAQRVELVRRLPELEAERLHRIANAERALADFLKHENAAVFDALHAHLARLGWRTMNEQDQARMKRRMLEDRLGVLRQVKMLEARRESTPPDWAQSLTPGDTGVKGTMFLMPSGELENMSDVEREASWPPSALAERLNTLAVTGRITKVEFDMLQARLAGKRP